MHGLSLRASGGVFGNCSYIALGFRSGLTSTSPIHGLVPPASMRSSGKRRGWCPSCASRRMAETGAHRVDNVLPHTPYRQGVLSFPWPLRLGCSRRGPNGLRGCWVWSHGHCRLRCSSAGGGGASLRGRAHRDGDVHLTAMDGGNAKGL